MLAAEYILIPFMLSSCFSAFWLMASIGGLTNKESTSRIYLGSQVLEFTVFTKQNCKASHMVPNSFLTCLQSAFQSTDPIRSHTSLALKLTL